MGSRVLIIAPYPIDKAPSQRFRFEQYVDYLEENNLVVDEVPFLDEKGWNTLYKSGSFFGKSFAMIRSFWRRFILLFRIRKYDFVLIHREASMIGPPFFEWVIAKVLRKKYIYDFDDAIWLPNFSDANAQFQKLKMYRKVIRLMKWADQITAGNEYLAEFARQQNQNVKVIPTTIDTENVHNLMGNTNKSPLIIGWTGTHTTAKYIKPLLPILDELIKDHTFIFRVISNQDPELNRGYVEWVKWNRETEITDLASFNIGVMPMSDNQWTKGKCGFKALQYMALGIPAVVSSVGANNKIINHEIDGYLCNTEDEWQSTLTLLINDPNLRQNTGVASRNRVKEHYSVIAQRQNFLNLFKK